MPCKRLAGQTVVILDGVPMLHFLGTGVGMGREGPAAHMNEYLACCPAWTSGLRRALLCSRIMKGAVRVKRENWPPRLTSLGGERAGREE